MQKPWHLANFAEGANPVSAQTLGAVAMPKVLALLIHIGRQIAENNRAEARSLRIDDELAPASHDDGPSGGTNPNLKFIGAYGAESAADLADVASCDVPLNPRPASGQSSCAPVSVQGQTSSQPALT